MENAYLTDPSEMPQAFVRAWNQKNPDALAALFKEDAHFVNVVGIWWTNRQDIYKAHEYGLRVIFPESVLSVGKVNHHPLSDDISLVHARMKLQGQSPQKSGQNSPGTRFTVFTFVMQRQDKGWLCAAAHNNDIVPGAETYIKKKEGLFPSDYRKEDKDLAS